jgi:hypothetical protein
MSISEEDLQAAMLWEAMPRMTDQEIRDVVKMYSQYFELKEDTVSFNWKEWNKSVS